MHCMISEYIRYICNCIKSLMRFMTKIRKKSLKKMLKMKKND